MNFSFDDIKDRIVTGLRSKASWADVLPYSTNMRLIDAVTKEIEELARYDEYLTRETKWELAQNRSSLVTQSQVLGYTPHRKIGTRQKLWVSTMERAFSSEWNSYTSYEEGDIVRHGDNNTLYQADIDNQGVEPPSAGTWTIITAVYNEIVGIPKYSIFQTEDGLQFCSQASNDLLTTENYTEIDVVQGTPRTFSTIAQGQTYEEIEVDNDSIDNSFYELWVNNKLWTEVDDIRSAEEDDQYYEIRNKIDYSGIYLVFGNGVTGVKLSAGDTITFKYVETEGELGNVVSKGSINTVVSTLYDNSGDVVDAYCYNNEIVSGGQDVETTEEIRVNAKNTYQSGGNLVGKSDYLNYLMTNFDFIGNAVVWGAYEQNVDAGNDPWTWISAQENLVYVSAFTTGTSPSQLSSTQKLEIVRDIEDLKPPSDIISFQDAVFVYMVISPTVYVSNRSYLLAEVEDYIGQEIWDKYEITAMDFEQNIYETNYHAFIDNYDMVTYHDTTIEFYSTTDFTAGDYSGDTPYQASEDLVMIPISSGTVKVYVKDDTATTPTYNLVATDDGSGGFTGESGYTVTGSTVNYTTGAVTLTLEDDDGSLITGSYENFSVKILYQTSEDDLELQGRNHIFYLKEVDVSAQYLD